MKFRAHDTFFIRKGWLSKGMKNVLTSPDVFTSREKNPMDVLGIGANMVKALRYWLVATGLTYEQREGNKTVQRLTAFGKIIHENDPYLEEMGTLFLLHYNLVKANDKRDEKGYKISETEATAWWYFFNDFKANEFTQDDFLIQIGKFIRKHNEEEKPARTVEDDFKCIINTYVPRIKSNPKKVDPESNIDCPLGELGLIDIVGTEKNGSRLKIYRKAAPKKDVLHPIILLAILCDQAEETAQNTQRQVRISAIQNDNGNAGKVFNLDIIYLTALLYKIETLRHIKVNRTAGLDVIDIVRDWGFLDCVREYYKAING